jgi:hypothetical protein
MFESLDEQMKADDAKAESARARYMRWLAGAVGGLVILGALLFGVHLLQG